MGILLAWVAAILTGLEVVITKMTSQSLVRSPWLFNIFWLTFCIPPIVMLALFQGGSWPTDWTNLMLVALASAGFFTLYTLAIYKLDVTTIGPLFSIRTATSVLLGLILVGESTTALGILLICLIILASPLASYDEHLRLKAFLRRHVWLAVGAMVSLAFMGYFTNRSVATNGYATTILWQDILTLMVLLPTLRLVKRDQERITKRSLIPFVCLGIIAFVYTATTTYAYAKALALSSVIVSLPFSMIIAYFLSFRYPGLLERHPQHVYVIRFLGAAIMVGGAVWLSLL